MVAWVVATAMAMLLASQAVALVRDQVTDRPSKVATTSALETTTSTTTIPTTTEPPPVSPTTTTLAETTTTTLTETTATTQTEVTTTSVPATSSTTTTTTNEEETFYLVGGWATVRCAGDDVILATYAPNAGYQVEIESAGPVELEIKFEESGGDHESRLKVHCNDGALDPDTEERDDD